MSFSSPLDGPILIRLPSRSADSRNRERDRLPCAGSSLAIELTEPRKGGRRGGFFAIRVDENRPQTVHSAALSWRRDSLHSAPRHQALRTVWLSDIHLGSPECRVNLLLDFLRHTRCEQLYLVGDIIDLEHLRKTFYWPASHTEALRLLLEEEPRRHAHRLLARQPRSRSARHGRREIRQHRDRVPGDPHDARRPAPARDARRPVRCRRAPPVARRLARRFRVPAFVDAESLRALAARLARPALLVARAARQGALPGRAALHRTLPQRDARGCARSGSRRRRLRPHPSRRLHDVDGLPTATTATGSRAARRSSKTTRGELSLLDGGRRPRRSPRPPPATWGGTIASVDSEQEAAYQLVQPTGSLGAAARERLDRGDTPSLPENAGGGEQRRDPNPAVPPPELERVGHEIDYRKAGDGERRHDARRETDERHADVACVPLFSSPSARAASPRFRAHRPRRGARSRLRRRSDLRLPAAATSIQTVVSTPRASTGSTSAAEKNNATRKAIVSVQRFR